ncbi:uncharacterized protein LOC124133886 isoform X2 [Haliotis rufescens]|uniref:uncharacterized protein LOC124133886 isoform X2 n=1 Tax=Haliotis rufescens TaxID=6454 RepID=UPI00201EA576|nr:uncharacterized protein LOC124133886 isoform X2 [Haliotis rufescens]
MAFFMNYAQCLLLIQMGIGTEAVTCNFPDGPNNCTSYSGEKNSFSPELFGVVAFMVVLLVVGIGIVICCCRGAKCKQKRRQLTTRITDCCSMRNRAPSSSDLSKL